MGVDRELLYGSAPGGAHRIITPRGQPPEALPPIPFAARSIFVENPSGVWYVVNGFTVPPWTWGLVNRLDVPTASVAVARLTTPEVLISEDFGGDLTIVAYEDALAPSLGRSLYPPPHDVLVVELATFVPEAGGLVSTEVVAAVADRRIVPLWTTIHARGDAGVAPRGLVVAAFHYLVGGVPVQVADHAISPEAPHAPPVPIDRPLPVETALAVHAYVEAGAGLQGIEAIAHYYIALP